jgi:putative PIN family toxin of toxin-antitoxin system
MPAIAGLRVVIDTNVIFEGLTKQGGAAGLIVDLWLAGLLEVCVSDAIAYEYEDVLARKLNKQRWQKIQPVLRALLNHAQFTAIYYSWRPTSPDPGNGLAIDCAMNAGAILVTSNIRDFQKARKSLGLKVMTPTELVNMLATYRREP